MIVVKLNYYEYVKKYISFNFSEYLKDLTDVEYRDLVISVTTDVEKKYKDINELRENRADVYILRKVVNYLNKNSSFFKANYVNLENYVTKYINGNYMLNCSDKTIEYISRKICTNLIVNFNYNSLNKGYYDNKIENLYNDILNSIRNYIIKYININIAPLIDVNQEEIANEMIHLLLENDKYNVVDLYNGKYNNLIEMKALINADKNKKKRINRMHNYIRNVIKDRVIDVDKIDDFVLKIYDGLVKKGMASDILSGKIDNEILEELRKYNYQVFKPSFSEDMIRDNSVKKEGEPSKIGCRRRKKRVNRAIITLVLAGTLIGGLSYCENQRIENIRYNNGISIAMEMDGYSYPSIRSKDDKNFKNTVGNVISTFDYYSSFGNDNFKYLAFYRAYNSMSKDKLYLMDELIDDVKNNYSDNGKILKEELIGTPNFISFMYKRICDTGYDKINKSSVDKLLSSYANYTYKYPYSDVTRFLNEDEKKLLDKLFTVYDELSRDNLSKLGIFIDSNLEMENVSGKGH